MLILQNTFFNMPVGNKLFFGFGIILIVIIVAAIAKYFSLAALMKNNTNIQKSSSINNLVQEDLNAYLSAFQNTVDERIATDEATDSMETTAREVVERLVEFEKSAQSRALLQLQNGEEAKAENTFMLASGTAGLDHFLNGGLPDAFECRKQVVTRLRLLAFAIEAVGPLHYSSDVENITRDSRRGQA